MLSALFDVRAFGACCDGSRLATAAIQAAIDAAAVAGGGTVYLPAGRYLSFSLRLRSRVVLHLGPGAVLEAADPRRSAGGYDAPESNEWGDVHGYQDFGHSHFRNSLIWGEGLEDIAIVGAGRIDGAGLTRAEPRSPGEGNKAIALKLCRHVLLRDLALYRCGHFALLATGVDNLTIDNLRIDTNRDGIDIDCCRHVRISNCTVNTCNDDAIVLKSSYVLGQLRPTENVTITNCEVTGFDPGTLLDGTFGREKKRAPDGDGPTGRIKLGTESNGGFRNITICNCIFQRSRGLCLETVDGGVIEDVSVSNIVMREVSSSPIFIRLGHRARGPSDTPVGAVRRLRITGLTASGVDGRFASILAGLEGHPLCDVEIRDIHIVSRGGVRMRDVAEQPRELVNRFFLRDHPEAVGPRDPFAVPELGRAYPEPSAFGLLPAWGLYIRHARRIVLGDITLRLEPGCSDERVPIVLDDVDGARLEGVVADRPAGSSLVQMRRSRDVQLRGCGGAPDAVCDAPGDAVCAVGGRA
ncbi:MAG: glycoside hydrolase family 28 protein [Verrucomicrobia bacterium]|nr:MAG: glycoside hydrolase family 28 protein [Verrucomicrobiota bacterium]